MKGLGYRTAVRGKYSPREGNFPAIIIPPFPNNH